MSNILHAPWTPEQVTTLNRYQRDERFHPFTCGSGNRTDEFHAVKVRELDLHDAGQLHATVNGWVCPACDYTQPWALMVMLDMVELRDRLDAQLRAEVEGDTVK